MLAIQLNQLTMKDEEMIEDGSNSTKADMSGESADENVCIHTTHVVGRL